MYHELLEQVLDSVDELLIAQTIVVGQCGTARARARLHLVFPDHWASIRCSVDYHRFRRLIANLIFFLTPVGDNGEYRYSFSADGLDEHEIAFLELNRSLYLKPSAQTAASYDSARSLRFRIHTVTLSELQRNAELIPSQNAVLFDFDLDVLICASLWRVWRL